MELEEAIKNNQHLGLYLRKFQEQTGVLPSFIPQLSRDIDKKNINVIYPVGDPIFIHLYGTEKIGIKYFAIEPELTPYEQEKYQVLLGMVLRRTPEELAADTPDKLREHFIKLLDKMVVIGRPTRKKSRSKKMSSGK